MFDFCHIVAVHRNGMCIRRNAVFFMWSMLPFCCKCSNQYQFLFQNWTGRWEESSIKLILLVWTVRFLPFMVTSWNLINMLDKYWQCRRMYLYLSDIFCKMSTQIAVEHYLVLFILLHNIVSQLNDAGSQIGIKKTYKWASIFWTGTSLNCRAPRDPHYMQQNLAQVKFLEFFVSPCVILGDLSNFEISLSKARNK